MRELFMSAGIVSTIILCFVGIVKLPFKHFKKSHPKWYRAIFTILSIILIVGLSILDEIYILCGKILSVEFAILICTVFAGVFGGYGGVYEGLGIKELVKRIVESIKKARDVSQNKKAIKFLSKIDDIDKAIALLEERKHNSEV